MTDLAGNQTYAARGHLTEKGFRPAPTLLPLIARCVLVALFAGATLLPRFASAHTGEETTGPGGMITWQEGDVSIGLDERLGAKIPLDLTFRDETGRPVRLGDLVTGPTIILPVYYSCTHECNLLQQGLASALPDVKLVPGKDYRVISVSFDETETPALAARYKRSYLTSMNSPFPDDGWRFLTGDAPAIRRLTDAAGYHFERKGREFVHPVASFVVARDGTIVRYLYGTLFLPKDLTLAFLEAQRGTVGGTVRRVVGYCFSFDPATKTYVFNLLRVTATVVLTSMGAFLAFLLLTGKKRGKAQSRKS